MLVYISFNYKGIQSISKTEPNKSNYDSDTDSDTDSNSSNGSIQYITFDENIADIIDDKDEGYVIINVPDNTTELHFFEILLEKGGCYNRENYVYCLKTYDDVENMIQIFLDTEHNLDNECDDCNKDENICFNKLKNELKEKGYTPFISSIYEPTLIYYNKKILKS